VSRFFILVLVAAAAIFIVLRPNGEVITRLSPGGSDLQKHAIFKNRANVTPSVLFFGSSEVHGLASAYGELMPSPYSYDLATLNGNILNSLSLASKMSTVKSKVLLLGLAPTDQFFLPLWSDVVLKDPEAIRPYVSADLFSAIQRRATWKNKFFLTFARLSLLTERLPTGAGEFLQALRFQLYRRIDPFRAVSSDPYLKMNVTPLSLLPYDHELLSAFKQLAQDNGSQLIVYFAPYHPTSEYDREVTSLHLSRIKKILQEESIPLLDYREIFSGEYAYLFTDNSHLVREGNLMLALQLATDLSIYHLPGSRCDTNSMTVCLEQKETLRLRCLRDHLVDLKGDCATIGNPWETADPCEADMKKSCRESQPEERENCLWKNLNSFTADCRARKKLFLVYDACIVDRHTICGNVATEKHQNCLLAHLNDLSPKCRQVKAEVFNFDSCRADVAIFCQGMTPEKGDFCLADHLKELSEDCRKHTLFE
jgi:hypothetical protein